MQLPKLAIAKVERPAASDQVAEDARRSAHWAGERTFYMLHGPSPGWQGGAPAVQGLPRVGRLVHRLSMNQRAGVRLRRTMPALMRLLVCREAGRMGPASREARRPLPSCAGEGAPASPETRRTRTKEGRARRSGHAPLVKSTDYPAWGFFSTGTSSALRRRPRNGCTPNSASFSEPMP